VLSWLQHPGKGKPNEPTPILGLWHLKYAADGSAFLESFKTWHGAARSPRKRFLPPAGGNVCFGVWKQASHLNYKLITLTVGSTNTLADA
jgi:hypothetical protein